MISLNLNQKKEPEESKPFVSPIVLQCCTLLLVVCGAIYGVSTYFSQVKLDKKDAELAKKDVELANANSKIEEMHRNCRASREEHDFLVLDQRRRSKEKAAAKAPANKAAQKEAEEAQQAEATYIDKHADKNADDNGVSPMNINRDPDRSKSTIIFKSGREYEISPEVKSLTDPGLWSAPHTTPLENVRRVLLKPRETAAPSKAKEDTHHTPLSPMPETMPFPHREPETSFPTREMGIPKHNN